MSLARRTVLRALAGALFLPSAAARADAGWEGTWVAQERGQTLQVIVAGGEAVGLFWSDDYRSVARTARDPAAGTLTVLWDGGRIVLSARAGRAAIATIHAGGRPPIVARVRLD